MTKTITTLISSLLVCIAAFGQSTEQQVSSVVTSSYGDWSTFKCGGSLSLSINGSEMSSSMQARMIKDEAILVSIRPMLGYEVGKLIITSDSVFIINKYHHKWLKAPVSMLVGGVPVNVSTLQDIILSRAFVIGSGTLSESNADKLAFRQSSDSDGFSLESRDSFYGYTYSFDFTSTGQLLCINVTPVSTTEDASIKSCQATFSDETMRTQASEMAKTITLETTYDNYEIALELEFSKPSWDETFEIDATIPGNYKEVTFDNLNELFSK